MRFYIASGLPNFENVRVLAKALTDAGHTWTYDWTAHGSVKDRPEVWEPTALAEMQGVTSADVLILMHPGGRGTHVELGMALAKGIPVIMLGQDPTHGFSGVFYSHPLIYNTAATCGCLNCTLTFVAALELLGLPREKAQ